jgi:hypothetical protein
MCVIGDMTGMEQGCAIGFWNKAGEVWEQMVEADETGCRRFRQDKE